MNTQPLDDRDVAPWADDQDQDEYQKERENERIEADLYPSEGYDY